MSVADLRFTFLFYFPLAFVVRLWLPQYSDSIDYMSVLCGICLFEGKMSMLCTTYMKCLNEQRVLLKINAVTVFVSGVMAILSSMILHNLSMVIYSMIVAVALRYIMSVLFIQWRMGMANNYSIIAQDLLVMALFLFFQFLCSETMSFFAISLILIFLFYYRKKEILSYIKIFEK